MVVIRNPVFVFASVPDPVGVVDDGVERTEVVVGDDEAGATAVPLNL